MVNFPFSFTGGSLKKSLRVNDKTIFFTSSNFPRARGNDRIAPAEIPEITSGLKFFSIINVSATPNKPAILVPPPEMPKCFITENILDVTNKKTHPMLSHQNGLMKLNYLKN